MKTYLSKTCRITVGITIILLISCAMFKPFEYPYIPSESKYVVAVKGFSSHNRDLGDKATAIFNTELVSSGCFKVLERGKLENLMSEISLQQTGMTASNRNVVGYLQEAEFIITGEEVTGGGFTDTDLRDSAGNGFIGRTYKVNVDCSIADIKSGQLMYSFSGQGSSQSGKLIWSYKGKKNSTSMYKSEAQMRSESLRQAIISVSHQLVKLLYKKYL